MKILLSNDDGIDADGLTTAIAIAAAKSDLLVVAPLTEQSGKSHAITKDKPLRLRKVRDNAYALSGTPADCIKFALFELLQNKKPDLVVSGINHGANLGQDTIYSGTVAAAVEAAMNGLPAIALSLCGLPPYNFDTAGTIMRIVIEEFATSIPSGRVLNVNIPNIAFSEIKGMKFATLGRRHYERKFHKAPNPRNIPYYWMGWTFGGFDDKTPGSDCVAVDANYVSLTILKPSLLDRTTNDKFTAEQPLVELASQ